MHKSPVVQSWVITKLGLNFNPPFEVAQSLLFGVKFIQDGGIIYARR